MYCKKCGNELSENDIFCNICGTKAESNNIIGKEVDNNKIRILYQKESMIAPNSKKVYIDGVEVEIRDNEIVEYILDDSQEHIIKWDKTSTENIGSCRFKNNNQDINLLVTFKTIDGVHYKFVKENFNIESKSETKRRNLLKFFLVILIILVIIITINLFNKIRYSNDSSVDNDITSNYSNELSSAEANRLLEATINYIKANPFIITGCGNVLNEGTYRYRESKDGKYIYDMSIKYNPLKTNGDADTTSIRSKTVYTFYDSKNDKFSVHIFLESAQKEMNK